MRTSAWDSFKIFYSCNSQKEHDTESKLTSIIFFRRGAEDVKNFIAVSSGQPTYLSFSLH